MVRWAGILHLVFLANAESSSSWEDTGFVQLHRKKHRFDRSVETETFRRCAKRVPYGIFGANDGPAPYTMYPEDVTIPSEEMGEFYAKMGFQGVRPDEAGKAFHISCMFPVSDLAQIPDPLDDRNWNWHESDKYINAILRAGLAPFLKIPVLSWQSTRLTGLAYWDETLQETVQKIPPVNYDNCAPWPSVSGVINQVGPQLVMKIVERYNDFNKFPVPGRPGQGALDKGTFKGFNGVELMNEWQMMTCFPSSVFIPGSSLCDQEVTDQIYADYCFAKPYQWSSRYWDGTPEAAWAFYANSAKALKENPKTQKVRVGGPATGTSSSFWPCQVFEGIAKKWVVGFLNEIKRVGDPLDFFSFHYYDQGQGQNSSMPLTVPIEKFRTLLDQMGFTETVLAITEYNAPFELGNETKFVGSVMGAAENAAKLVQMVNWDVQASFIYTGRDGAFEPGNPYSFPLGCPYNWTSDNPACQPQASQVSEFVMDAIESPEGVFVKGDDGGKAVAYMKTHGVTGFAGCTPRDVLMWNLNGSYLPQGTWDQRCSRANLGEVTNLGACANNMCSFGPKMSGMGSAFSNGRPTPMGALWRLFRTAAGACVVQPSQNGANQLAAAQVYSLAWKVKGKDIVKLLLVNPQWTSSSPINPSTFFPRMTLLNVKELVQSYTGENAIDVSVWKGYTSQRRLLGASQSLETNNGGLTLQPFQSLVFNFRMS